MSGIGEVEDVTHVAIGVRCGDNYHGVYFDEGDVAKLVTPVEHRFDK